MMDGNANSFLHRHRSGQSRSRLQPVMVITACGLLALTLGTPGQLGAAERTVLCEEFTNDF